MLEIYFKMLECTEVMEEEMKEVETQMDDFLWPDSIMPTRSLDDTVDLGREIYERDIRRKVEKVHVGKICAIDVDSGCWALGDDNVIPDDEVAVARLRKKKPEAVNIYCERVGYAGARSFGGAMRRKPMSKSLPNDGGDGDLIGSLKHKLKVKGDVFSTGRWRDRTK